MFNNENNYSLENSVVPPDNIHFTDQNNIDFEYSIQAPTKIEIQNIKSLENSQDLIKLDKNLGKFQKTLRRIINWFS